MSQVPTLVRWRAAVTQAARSRSTLEALEAARFEFGALLHTAARMDVRAVRKAAQRVHDPEQLRAVLARAARRERAHGLSAACTTRAPTASISTIHDDRNR